VAPVLAVKLRRTYRALVAANVTVFVLPVAGSNT
jgi:hypothetical protein